jgi:hypothetical protein
MERSDVGIGSFNYGFQCQPFNGLLRALALVSRASLNLVSNGLDSPFEGDLGNSGAAHVKQLLENVFGFLLILA